MIRIQSTHEVNVDQLDQIRDSKHYIESIKHQVIHRWIDHAMKENLVKIEESSDEYGEKKTFKIDVHLLSQGRS